MAAATIDLCSVADVQAVYRGDGPGEDLIQAHITEVSEKVLEWTAREIKPVDAQAAARLFEISAHDARERRVHIGDLKEAPTGVRMLDADGALSYVIATDDVEARWEYQHLYSRAAWHPITTLLIRPGSTTPLIAGRRLEVTGAWGFPAVPTFAKEAVVDTVVNWLRFGAPERGGGSELDDLVTPGPRSLSGKAENLIRRLRVPVVA